MSPLLPSKPEHAPFVPSPTLALDLLSAHTSPDARYREAFERTLWTQDSIGLPKPGPEGEPSQESMLLDYAEHGPAQDGIEEAKLDLLRHRTSSQKRQSSRELRVEVPLTPRSVPDRTGESADNECSIQGWEQMFSNLPEKALPGVHSFSDLLDEDFLGEIARLASERIEEQLDSERLEAIDIARIDRPELLSPMPCKTLKPIDLWAMRDTYLKQSFAMDAKVERELLWTPFPPALAAVKIQEALDLCQIYLNNILEESGAVNGTKSEDLLWKPDGLGILNDESEYEVLQLAQPEESHEHRRDLLSQLEDGVHVRFDMKGCKTLTKQS